MKSFDKFKPFIHGNSQLVKKTIQTQGMTSQTLAGLYSRFISHLVPVDECELDCTAGCGFCCHLKVTASLAEVVIIVDQLVRKGLVDSYLERIAESVDPVSERSHKNERWWSENGISCIFHDEQSRLCTIYEMRPFSCRGYHSRDKQLCQKGYSPPFS